MVKFVRRIWYKYSKLGKRRKKKQVWRRPTGRDNPMREKRKGYPASVNIGYKSSKKDLGKIKGKNPVIVKILKDLEKVKKNDIVFIGSVGKKKKIDLVKKAKEKGLEVSNVNVKKFLKKNKEKKNESK
jgi:large subunit ribosomal protein L32e